MSIPLLIAIYFVLWWIVLFAILPFGVRTQGEEGVIVPGTPVSAPVRPLMLRKMLATTVVSAVLLGVGYWAYVSGVLDGLVIPPGATP